MKRRIQQQPATPRVEPYQLVIDVLLAGEFNPTEITRLLAKEHPELFLSLHNRTNASIPPWVKGVVASVASGNLVSAIKELRAATGWGLKESKDVVDVFRGRRDGSIVGAPAQILSADQHQVVEMLLRSSFDGRLR